MSDRTRVLNTRDDILELAERYETVAALDLTPQRAEGVRAVPGSRVPPGMQEVLNDDEVQRATTALDEWTEFVAHVIAEECDATMPDSTPARLRAIAPWTEHMLDHDDELLALAFADDLHEHLKAMRRLAGRGIRRVRTGMRCQDPACSGHYVSPLGTSSDRHDDAIECDKCKHRVPYVVWSSWPRARVQYVTVEHAARMAETTVAAIKMRASRYGWRRIGTGRDVRYHVEDVRGVSDLSA